MQNLNSILLEGNLVDDPKLVTMESGTKLTKFKLASNHYYKAKNGEVKANTVFIFVECWAGSFDKVMASLAKGTLTRVVGRLKMNSWTDDEGKTRESFSIVANYIEALGKKKQIIADISEDEQNISF